MNPAKFKLSIHHHDIAYTDNVGRIWLTAGIGRWVEVLSNYFKEIHLLLHESSFRLPRQDTSIERENVILESLGPPGRYWDYIKRIRRIRQVCQRVGRQTDGLLIRGLTPRQYTIWKNTPVPQKAFLLVRSPKQSRLIKFSASDILSVVRNKQREYEFGQMAKNNTLLLANSPLHVNEIKQIYRKNAFFVPTNTIKVSEFAPLLVRPISKPIKLLYCGRLNMMKGLRELFQAVANLNQQEQIVELDLVVALIEPVFFQLQELASQLGIVDKIHWRGYKPYGPELFRFYLNADVFVLPTYTEGFPRVLWEAAANCCPIVTTAVGGIPALWKHEEHGLLIPPKDVDALVLSLQRMFTDVDLRTRLVKQAYQHALSYSVEACACKMSQTLSERWD